MMSQDDLGMVGEGGVAGKENENEHQCSSSHIEGSGPEWCISTTYMLEMCHSGPETSICLMYSVFSKLSRL